MNSALIILALAIVACLGLFVLPVLMTRWAARRVIKIFCRHNAVSAGDARTAQELGLVPLSFVDRLMKPRDYKPQALRFLKESGVVQSTPDGRLYLSEIKAAEGLRCADFIEPSSPEQDESSRRHKIVQPEALSKGSIAFVMSLY